MNRRSGIGTSMTTAAAPTTTLRGVLKMFEEPPDTCSMFAGQVVGVLGARSRVICRRKTEQGASAEGEFPGEDELRTRNRQCEGAEKTRHPRRGRREIPAVRVSLSRKKKTHLLIFFRVRSFRASLATWSFTRLLGRLLACASPIHGRRYRVPANE